MINFAHRGASGNYPENTILSLKEAIKCKATGIEIDVHKTKDDKLVVIHDENVKRTFQGEGLVKDFTLKELKKLKNKQYENNKETVIPTLEEVLDLIENTNIILNIELKTDNIHYDGIERDVINLIKKYNIEKRIILSSFNHKSIKICKEIDEDIKTGILYDKEIKNIIQYAKDLKANALHPCAELVTKELIEEAHKNNIEVNIYTVNEFSDINKFREMKADGLFSDYPERFN